MCGSLMRFNRFWTTIGRHFAGILKNLNTADIFQLAFLFVYATTEQTVETLSSHGTPLMLLVVHAASFCMDLLDILCIHVIMSSPQKASFPTRLVCERTLNIPCTLFEYTIERVHVCSVIFQFKSLDMTVYINSPPGLQTVVCISVHHQVEDQRVAHMPKLT